MISDPFSAEIRPSRRRLLTHGLPTAAAIFTAAACVRPVRAATPVAATLEIAPLADRFVAMRWPDTTLATRDAGKLVEIDDRDGTALPFTFVVAPNDIGHPERPLWLVLRLTGRGPYTLRVGANGHAGLQRDWTDVVDDPGLTLAALPAAGVEAREWGDINSWVADAEAVSDASNRHWRYGAVISAVVGVSVLGWIISRFARTQPHNSDISKL